MPFSFGPHADTEGTHFLWLQLFAYTLSLSSCLLALTSCQTDRGFMPTRWQVSDGKALHLKKTLRPLSLHLPAPPSPPSSVLSLFSSLSKHQHASRDQIKCTRPAAFFFFFFCDINHDDTKASNPTFGDPPGARLSSSLRSHPPDLQI